jgi:hypothetical protein
MCRPCMRESIFTSGSITSFKDVRFSMGIPGTSDVWALSSRFNLAPVRAVLLPFLMKCFLSTISQVIIRTETNAVAELWVFKEI